MFFIEALWTEFILTNQSEERSGKLKTACGRGNREGYPLCIIYHGGGTPPANVFTCVRGWTLARRQSISPFLQSEEY